MTCTAAAVPLNLALQPGPNHRASLLSAGSSAADRVLEAELQALSPAPAEPADASKAKPRRAPLPAHLPRVEISHEPENTQCGCGCTKLCMHSMPRCFYCYQLHTQLI